MNDGLANNLVSASHGRGSSWLLLACTIMALGLLAASLCVGYTPLTISDVAEGLLGTHSDADVNFIVRDARLPRTLMAMLVGGALAAGGLVMQTISRNPLATPSVLGVGNGANLGLLLIVVLSPDASDLSTILASFAGAVGSAGVIGLMGLSFRGRMDRDALVVGGTILAALEGSILTAILFFYQMQGSLLGWTIGRLVHVDWVQVEFILPVIAAGLLLIFVLIDRLEAFLLGDTVAASLGLPVGLLHGGAMLAVVLLAGASVAAAGPIPYVGLVVPHILSRERISSPRVRFLLCVFGGAILAGAADLLSRLVSDPSKERAIPMGIWIMCIGAVFFLMLSVRSQPMTADRMEKRDT